jgi:hypothetical protein
VWNRTLKDRAAIKTDEKSQERYEFHMKYIQPCLTVVITLYYFLMPLLQCPEWCNEAALAAGTTGEFLYNCTELRDGTVKYSDFPKLAPYASGSFDLFFLTFMTGEWLRSSLWRNFSKMDKVRIPIMIVIYITCVIDLILSMAYTHVPYINNLFKPFVVLLFLPIIRNNIKTVLLDLKDSMPVLAIIFAFIFFFSFSGYFFFQGTLEGVTTFPNI